MLRSLTVLLGFQLAGEFLQNLLQLPVPGPVLGMLLLLCVLIARGRITPGFAGDTQQLLRYLPLILIPPSVGIMNHWDLLARNSMAVVLVIVLTTLISLLFAAWFMAQATKKS